MANSDSETDDDEDDDYQVFGRMTIKAQSQAFFQVGVLPCDTRILPCIVLSRCALAMCPFA